MLTQTGMMLLAFVLAGLVISGVVQAWHILVLAFFTGMVNAFDTPARQSFVVELVDRSDLTNAIALNATMFNSGAIMGPAVGGMLYALAGPEWCFTINGISFLAVIAALALMRINSQPIPAPRTRAIDAIAEGFNYVKSDRLIATLTFTVFYMNVFAFGLLTLMPAWAVNILHGDVTTNGVLLSSRGVGAVIGGLTIAALSGKGVRGKMWFIASLTVPLAMAAFAAARWLPISMAFLALMGLSLISVMNNSNALVQSRVPDGLRGRVMGLYSLMFMGGGPLGSLMVGQIAERFGEPPTLYFCAAMVMAYMIAVAVFRPEVRRAK
jgi:predicted MFS family arabinose efflux permease